MRRAIITLGLVIVLWAVFQLNRLVKDWHYVVPAEPGNLLYVASFDDDALDWEQDEGNEISSQLVDGAMRIAIHTDYNGLYSAASPYFGDFDVQVEARVKQGIFDGNNNNGYGILFRQFNRDNYFIFLVSNDGSYRVMRVVDGRSSFPSAWVTTEAIHTREDTINTLRVVGEGDQFQFYINGEQMLLCIPHNPDAQSTMVGGVCLDGAMKDTLVDESIKFGRLGVAVQSQFGWETGIIVDFDNVIVYGPQPIADNE